MIVAVVTKLVGFVVPGWASIFVVTLFLGAVQLLCLGLLGEYVGRIYAAIQGRPAYFIGSDSARPGTLPGAELDSEAREAGLSPTR
jgi:dolichol-phosphate mannosyltransferase